MARVVVAPAACDDLDRLIDVLQLPADTWSRVTARLGQLSQFPEGGQSLERRWDGFRFILGPWHWMLIIYAYDEAQDQVSVLTIQDARSGRSATSDW